MIYYEYKFMNHLIEEFKCIDELSEEYKQLRYGTKKRILENTLDKCEYYLKNNDNNNYQIVVDNKLIYIDEIEFWDKWNEELVKTIEGE